MTENEIGETVLGAAMRVHSALGPGLLENAYEACLAHELAKSGLDVRRQVVLPVEYDGERIDVGYRIDMLVANKVVVEVKAIDRDMNESSPASVRIHAVQDPRVAALTQELSSGDAADGFVGDSRRCAVWLPSLPR